MITKHTDIHGHSSHATRGLDFLEAITPRLENMAQKGFLDGQDVLLLHTCVSAIPSYVADLSRCYGLLVERSRPGWHGMPTGIKDRSDRELHIGDTIRYDPREWGGDESHVVGWDAEECCPSFPGSVDTLRSWGDIVKNYWED